jgi:hypothetical protein
MTKLTGRNRNLPGAGFICDKLDHNCRITELLLTEVFIFLMVNSGTRPFKEDS